MHGSQLLQRADTDRPCAMRCAIEQRVVDDDEFTVDALVNVELDRIDAKSKQIAETEQAVFRPKVTGAAVSGNENHDRSFLFAAVDEPLEEPALQ